MWALWVGIRNHSLRRTVTFEQLSIDWVDEIIKKEDDLL